MLVKELAFDKRISQSLTDREALLFLLCIPHTDTDGTIPADPDQIRLIAFPYKEISEKEVSRIIKRWLDTDPPIVKEVKVNGRKKLYLTDFESSNYALDFLRKRRGRDSLSGMSGMSGMCATVAAPPRACSNSASTSCSCLRMRRS